MNPNDEADNLFKFSEETQNPGDIAGMGTWKILLVDDEPQVHEATKVVLTGFAFEKKNLQFYSAYSAKEAKNFLKKHPDMDVIILDVVMETDTAGIDFVKYVRETLKNPLVRIIVRTGQPGKVSEKKIVLEYDINDYKEKTETTSSQLFTSLAISLRTLSYLKKVHQVSHSRKKLLKIVEKFIPPSFVSLLGKKNILQIHFGDNIEKEMTVLFLDIRSYTSLSEFLTPLETFQFINECTKYLEPLIAKSNGFVDKYIGDSLMALFPDSPDEALKASINMIKVIEEYNVDRLANHKMPIKIGIGINTGLMVLGAVGSKHRMECTVISDTVNVASRIEKQTKIVDAPLLISENSFNALKNPLDFHHRYLGRMQLVGKKIVLGLYEIYDADPKDVFLLKEASQNDFKNAVKLYHANKGQEALSLFEKIYANNPHDTITKYFIEKIKQSSTK